MTALPNAEARARAADAASALTLSQALAEVLTSAHACLTADCREEDLPPSIALAQGSLRGEPVVLRSRRFVGGPWSSLVLAEITGERSGQLASTVIGLPAQGLGDSVLGVDLIAFGGRLSLAAIDLSPLSPEAWEAHGRPALELLRARTDTLTVPRVLPAFTHHTFSPLAMVVAARPGDDVALLSTLARWLPEAMRGRGQHRSTSGWATQQRWRQSERSNRKEADALARLFGADFARSYLEEFLFPLDA